MNEVGFTFQLEKVNPALFISIVHKSSWAAATSRARADSCASSLACRSTPRFTSARGASWIISSHRCKRSPSSFAKARPHPCARGGLSRFQASHAWMRPRSGMQRRNCPRAYVRLHGRIPGNRGPCSTFRRTLSREARGNVQRVTGLSADSARTGWRPSGSGNRSRLSTIIHSIDILAPNLA